MNTDKLAKDRRAICEACEHYRKASDSCTYILKSGKGRGTLTHKYGISNPRISCPILKWKSIPSRQAHLLASLLPEIDDATLHKITQQGLHQGSILKYVSRFYPTTNWTRTELMEKLSAISLSPNDYSHLNES